MVEVLAEFGSNKGQDAKIRIMLADDHPIMRQALAHILNKEADFEIIAEASDGEETVRLATELVPDVLIIDIGMPKLNGLEATRRIKAKCPDIAILVLTVHNDSELIIGALEAGAAGYLIKTVFDAGVINAVRGVACGESVLTSSILQQAIKPALRIMTKPMNLDASEKLTSREVAILKLAADGMSNKDIAVRLDLSLRTVKGYLTDIFSKLRVSSRTGAVIACLRAGLLTLDDLD